MGLLSCCYIYCPYTERVNQKNKSERKHKNNGVGVGNEENKKEKKGFPLSNEVQWDISDLLFMQKRSQKHMLQQNLLNNCQKETA